MRKFMQKLLLNPDRNDSQPGSLPPQRLSPFLLLSFAVYFIMNLNAYSQPLGNTPGLVSLELHGTVISAASGTPLPGVTILETGTNKGVASGMDGSFTIRVAGPGAVLKFTCIGYVSREFTVGEDNFISVLMEEDKLALDEIIVTGYGVQKKSDLTAAISTVRMDELPPNSSMSINNMIQGRVPGVDIVSINGMPGAGVSVKIRGVSSMNNSEPLYVIDGVHIRNFPGSNSNAFSMVNPNDVESVEILKDAASTAIYGSGGANGVILVTTKKGKKGAPVVNFKSQFGYAFVPKKLDVLRAGDYVDLLIEEQTAANPASPINEVVGPKLLDTAYSKVDRTYWQDEVFRKASLYLADLSVRGATDKASYMFSVGYANQEAIVIGADYTRYTMRMASDFTMGKKLKIGQNFNLSYTTQDNTSGTNLISNALRMSPYVPVRDSANWWGYGNSNNTDDNNNARNPVTEVAYNSNQFRRAFFFGNVYADLEILEGLNYYATVSTNFSQGFQSLFGKNYVNSSEIIPAFYEETNSWSLWPKFEHTLTFTRAFGKNTLTALAGTATDRYGTGRELRVTGVNYPNENLTNITLAGDNSIGYSGITSKSSLSYFGRLNYSYANRYLLTAIIRRDGSDRFAATNRWGTFPSVSAAWKIHEENFTRNNLPGISGLKLRVGWGKTGSDAIPEFQYSSYIHSVGISYPVGPPGSETYLTGATIKALASPDIKWEEAATTNLGLDLGILKNKLTLTLDFFRKKTYDILLGVATSPSMGLGLASGYGGGYRVANAANTLNKGIEALLRYDNFDRQFKYSLSANFTYLKNSVTGLGEGQPISGPGYNGQAAMTYTDIGHPIGAFYGYKVDRIYKDKSEIEADNAAAALASGGAVSYYQTDLTAPGDIRFKDLDNNGYINDNDRDYIGNPIPKFSYGFAMNAEYKGFDIAMNITGIAGVDIYSAFYTWSMLGMRLTSNHFIEVADRWTVNNKDASLPRAISNDPNNNLRTSDRYVYNGSFLKVRNITAGYNLPPSIYGKTGIQSFRIYLAIQNPITVSGYIGFDPEVSSYITDYPDAYNVGRGIDKGFVPNPRSCLLGIEMSF